MKGISLFIAFMIIPLIFITILVAVSPYPATGITIARLLFVLMFSILAVIIAFVVVISEIRQETKKLRELYDTGTINIEDAIQELGLSPERTQTT